MNNKKTSHIFTDSHLFEEKINDNLFGEKSLFKKKKIKDKKKHLEDYINALWLITLDPIFNWFYYFDIDYWKKNEMDVFFILGFNSLLNIFPKNFENYLTKNKLDQTIKKNKFTQEKDHPSKFIEQGFFIPNLNIMLFKKLFKISFSLNKTETMLRPSYSLTILQTFFIGNSNCIFNSTGLKSLRKNIESINIKYINFLQTPIRFADKDIIGIKIAYKHLGILIGYWKQFSLYSFVHIDHFNFHINLNNKIFSLFCKIFIIQCIFQTNFTNNQIINSKALTNLWNNSLVLKLNFNKFMKMIYIWKKFFAEYIKFSLCFSGGLYLEMTFIIEKIQITFFMGKNFYISVMFLQSNKSINFFNKIKKSQYYKYLIEKPPKKHKQPKNYRNIHSDF